MYNYRMKKVAILCTLIALLCGALSACSKDSATFTPPATHYEVNFSVDALGLEVTAPERVRVEVGKTVGAPILDVETPTGYTYIWTADVSSRAEFDFSQPISADLTLNAVQVRKAYSITYLCGDGTNNAKNPATYTMADTVSLHKATARFAYKFLYWSYWDDPSSQVFEIEEGTMGDIVLRAVYTAATYAIEYRYDVAAGGVNSSANPIAFTVEDDEIIFEHASLDGRIFTGWYVYDHTKGDGNGTFRVDKLSAEFFRDNSDDISVTSVDKIILEAHWEAADE